MKVGLLADIHANLAALSAVLAAARREGVTTLLVAGDLLGYYYQPQDILTLLDQWPWHGVRGNHEDMLAQVASNKNVEAIRSRYGSGLESAAQSLDHQAMVRLKSLPHPLQVEIGGRRVLMCHGSPWDLNEYVYPDAKPEQRNRMMDYASEVDLLVFGHTHYPVVWNVRNTENNSIVVNPGSVGQPRDRLPGACWALWSPAENTVDLRRETYDYTQLQTECRRRDPDQPYLSEVLGRHR